MRDFGHNQTRETKELDSPNVQTGHLDGFQELSTSAVKDLESVGISHVYPKGAHLFLKGTPPHGVYLLRSGQVNLFTSNGSKSISVRVVGPNEFLGLSAVLLNQPYELDAEVLETTQTLLILRRDFNRLQQRHECFTEAVAHSLSENIQDLYRKLTLVTLPPSAPAKIAWFLLDWTRKCGSSSFALPFTQKQIGEQIGLSRVTVSKILGDFRRKDIIDVRGIRVVLVDIAYLECLAR